MCGCSRLNACPTHLSHDEHKLAEIATLVVKGRLHIDDLISVIFTLESIYQGEPLWPSRR